MNSQGNRAAKPLTVYKKFGGNDDGREKTGGGVKQTHSGLFSDIGKVAEIPRHKIIDLVERSQRHVHSVSNELSVKNAA